MYKSNDESNNSASETSKLPFSAVLLNEVPASPSAVAVLNYFCATENTFHFVHFPTFFMFLGSFATGVFFLPCILHLLRDTKSSQNKVIIRKQRV